MQYLVMLYLNESAYAALSKEQESDLYAEHMAYMTALKEAGVTGPSAQLAPSAGAKTLRTRANGDQLVTDGPYAETQEQLGGFYVVEVADEDEALGWARRMPALPGDIVEVRRMM